LAAKKETGEITEEEYTEKMTKVAQVEERLKKYEEKVSKAKSNIKKSEDKLIKLNAED